MRWFSEAIQSPVTGKASSARLVAVVAGLSLSMCSLIMTVGLFFKDVFATPLTATVPFLATMAGASYVTAKMTSKNDGRRNDQS